MKKCVAIWCFMLVSVLTTPGLATWVDPVGGWQGVYDAASGLKPDEVGVSPQWTNSGFLSQYVYLTTDGGQPVLYLADLSSPYNDHYRALSGAGAGAYNDLITIEFKARLVKDMADRQFQIQVYRPNAAGTAENAFMFGLSKGGVYGSGGNNFAYDPMLVWHTYRVTIDVAARVLTAYVDGDTTPLYTDAGTVNTGVPRNELKMGYAQSSNWGETDLSYFKWTNSEIVVPEPATVLLLGLGTLAVFRRK